MAFGRSHDNGLLVGYQPDAKARAEDVSLLVAYKADAKARVIDMGLLVCYVPESVEFQTLQGRAFEGVRRGLQGSGAFDERK